MEDLRNFNVQKVHLYKLLPLISPLFGIAERRLQNRSGQERRGNDEATTNNNGEQHRELRRRPLLAHGVVDRRRRYWQYIET